MLGCGPEVDFGECGDEEVVGESAIGEDERDGDESVTDDSSPLLNRTSPSLLPAADFLFHLCGTPRTD